MRAVSKATLGDVRNELAEARVQMLGREAPHANLTKAWSVHHVSGVRKRMQKRADRRVLPLVHGFADLAHSKVEAGVHRVHQRRLPDTRGAGKHRRLSGQLVVQLSQANSLLDARVMNRIAGSGIIRERPLRLDAIDQLDLVDDDAGLKRVPLGDDEKPVQHSSMRFRFGGGKHDDDLIHIGRHDALALPCTRRSAREL